MQVDQISFRPALAADAATISALHVASWRDAYAHILDPDFLASAIDDDRMRCWSERFAEPRADQYVILALEGERRVGFVCLFADEDPEWGALIDNLHVLPELRGSGMGPKLLAEAARWAEKRRPRSPIHLWVFEANEKAMRFYLRLGGEKGETVISEMTGAAGQPVVRIGWSSAARLIEATGG